ncbi:MAG: glycosyltransferase family 39 protein [Nitrospirota bacterium]
MDTIQREHETNSHCHVLGRFQSLSKPVIALIMILSFAFNVWGNSWGAPDYWHPDELTKHAAGMVSGLTLNPHFFAYGGLHYYVLAIGAVIPAKVYGKLFDPRPKDSDTKIYSGWKERQERRVIILARSISALMATMQVFFTYLMGNMLFGSGAGILAALFLAVSPYFVGIAHFATVDTPANFWYWLSCFLALMFWKKGNGMWLVLASVTAGLAIGTKIDRLVILAPLFLSYVMRKEGIQIRKIFQSGALIIVGYIIANPTLLFSFFEFLDGTSRELFFNMMRGETGKTAYLELINNVKVGLGLPLFITATGGFAYALWNFVSGRNRAELVWLIATFVPYYLIVGSRFVKTWYALFFFPALTIFAAYGYISVLRSFQQRYVIVIVKALVILIISVSTLYSVSLILLLTNDSRYGAAQWVEQHVPIYATIEMGPGEIPISVEKYHLIKRAKDPAHYEEYRLCLERLDSHKPYQMIRQRLLDLEHFWAEKFGKQIQRKPYISWFDRIAETLYSENGDKIAFESPDYMILNGRNEASRVATLESPNSGYNLIAKFKYRNPLGIETPFSFVNPEIYIFRHHRAST